MDGLKPNRELMAAARQALTGRWNGGALAFLVYTLVVQFAGIIMLVIAGPIQLGLTRYFLNVCRGDKAEIEDLFSGFNQFGRAFCAALLSGLYVFLWSLLLIVPGILASLSYSMVYYILLDHPELSAGEAIDRSKQMMRGNRWKLVCLHCRFIGWGFLCLLTLFIGNFWLSSYTMVSVAKFYEDIRDRADELKVV